MKLRELAHSRTGDKGNTLNVSVICYDERDYAHLLLHAMAERLKAHLGDVVHGEVTRYELPLIGATNFVLRDALGGGVTRSLALDAHGKSLSSALLDLEIPARGYPQEVARVLTALCTNRVPSARLLAPDVRDKMDWLERQRYRTRHLPQGAPTSPALANLCAFRLTYTRYADDLAFSGDEDLARVVERLSVRVAAIALEEGFSIQLRKTRVMRRGARQHLAGVVANQHPNLTRSEFDTLKAILTNCVRHGAASQNREAHADFRAHLQGRVAQAVMLNAARGTKLKGIFERIVWDEQIQMGWVRNEG